MPIEENKALVRRWVELRNAHDVDEAIKLWTEHRQEGIRSAFNGFTQSFPDLHITIDDMIAEDDKVVCLWHFNATHLGTYGNIPATGNKVNWSVMDLYTIKDGKIADIIRRADYLGLLEQLGAKLA